MPPKRRSRATAVVLTVVALAAAVVVVMAGWQTSRAQVSATTENPANHWSAGTVELESDTPARLALNSREIWPGLIIEDCVLVTYGGSVPDVDVRIFGQLGAGTGLEEFLLATIETGKGGGSSSCDGFEADGQAVLSGDLETLLGSTYSAAPSILPHAGSGDEVVLRITVEVRDDNAAQGLTAGYSLVLEARP